MLGIVWVVLIRRHPAGWPRPRVVAGSAAFVLAVIATQSGVATHDTDSFTAHVLQHVLLGMAVPLLAALAAPITLVLQAADPATRQVLRRVLRHPVVAAVSRPVVGFVAFGVSVVALTFTPVLDRAAENDLVHFGVHAHLVLVGSLFVWPLVGVDPVPARPSHGARLLIVLAAVPFHAFVGVALLASSEPVLDSYPSLADQDRAAGILWGAGELLAVTTAAIVFADWYRADRRAAVRADRRAAAVSDPGGRTPPARHSGPTGS